VASYQFFGEFASFHQHWHLLVLEGGFISYHCYVYLPLGASKDMLKAWQTAILALFLRKEPIVQTRVNMLISCLPGNGERRNMLSTIRFRGGVCHFFYRVSCSSYSYYCLKSFGFIAACYKYYIFPHFSHENC
jgi:hypothetical protein